jgi:prevent-host-death family protein
MITVNFPDFKSHTDRYFEAVERGETVEIRRHGKPTAVLSPAGKPADDYWKRPIEPLVIKGLSLSKEILADREEGR